MDERTCSFDGCDRQAKAKSLCGAHYQQRSKGKELAPLRRPQPSCCQFPRCGNDPVSRGLCPGHTYQRSLGKPLVPLRTTQTAEEKFFARVRQCGDCWEWTAGITHKGYGTFHVGQGQYAIAHRWSYEFLRAEIPNGLVIDHLCRNRACVNPWHMEPVTSAVNTMRGEATSTIHARKTHCDHGHPFAGDNLRVVATTGERVCRECERERGRRYKERRRQQLIVLEKEPT